MLNDNTMEKLQKGLIYEYEEGVKTSISDAELVTVTGMYKEIVSKIIEPEPSKDLKKRIRGKSDQQAVSSNILILLSLILIDMVYLMRLRLKTIMIIVYILLVS